MRKKNFLSLWKKLAKHIPLYKITRNKSRHDVLMVHDFIRNFLTKIE